MPEGEQQGAALFLTGASGFLGSTLARHALALGREVHGFVRATSNRFVPPAGDLHWHVGDVTDAASVSAAMATAAETVARCGKDLDVVHAAACITYRRRDRRLAERVNVGGTRNVLAAAHAVGVRRVCHVSSVVTVGVSPDAHRSLGEDAEFNGQGLRSVYVDTKLAAERLALGAEGTEVVVVNPGAVFGPAPSGSNTTTFLTRAARGGLGPFAPPGSLATVGVEDVARGILAALERGRPGHRYLLTAENLTQLELLRRASAAFGRGGPVGVVPAPLWRGLCLGLAWLERLAPLREVTGEALTLLGVHLRFDSARAREELGFAPDPFDHVLAETVRWMRGAGLAPPAP